MDGRSIGSGAQFGHGCRQAAGLYSPEDIGHGGFDVLDRAGTLTKFPVMTISFGVTSTLSGPFADADEAIRTASRLKGQAKRLICSAVYAERGYRTASDDAER